MKEFVDKWATQRDLAQDKQVESPIELAHYTTLTTIVLILQDDSGGLRLSDTSTMNDPSEGLSTVAGRVIDNLLNNIGKDSWLYQRYSHANICCFVGADDETIKEIIPGNYLLYWRLYGNDCRGVSISLPTYLVKKLVTNSIIDRVIYLDEKKDFEIEETNLLDLLKEIEKLHCEAYNEGVWSTICDIILPVTDQFFKQRFLYKRSDFKMEREYRAITFISNDEDASSTVKRGQHVQFGLIRNYVQIQDLNRESIFTSGTKIILGKNVQNSNEACEDIKDILIKRGFEISGISVSVSKTEYRPRSSN